MASASTVRNFTELVSLRNFIPTVINALRTRSFAASAGQRDDSEREGRDSLQRSQYDPKYRSATEVLWPASKHQQRFASKVHLALETALTRNHTLRDTLVSRLGFAVMDVRMSPDNLKAFIQWDSVTGQATALQRELVTLAPRLRSAVGAALHARNVPQLVFRHDGLTPQQQAVEEMFRRLDEEEAAERQGWEEGTAAYEAAEPTGAAEESRARRRR